MILNTKSELEFCSLNLCFSNFYKVFRGCHMRNSNSSVFFSYEKSWCQQNNMTYIQILVSRQFYVKPIYQEA